MAAKTVLVAFLLIVSAAVAGTARACQVAGNPILDDDFKNPDPGWGRADTIAEFAPNGLALTPPPNGSAWRINKNYKIEASDWCIDVTSPANLPQPLDPRAVGDVGLWFWGQDNQNFYTATISLAGSIAIDRLVGGAWQVIVAPTRSPAVKPAAGASNELEVVLKGDTGAFFVNGVRVTDFRGQAPPGGGAPGLYGESGPRGTTWVFTRARLY